MNYKKLLNLILVTGCLGASAKAEDLFLLRGTDFQNGGIMDSISSDNFFDDIIGDDSEFSLFEFSEEVAYDLDYLGIKNFMSYNVMPDVGGLSAVFNAPSAGISQTFTGLNREDVDDQLEAFLEGGAYSKILQSAQEQSLVAVTDGNPNSTTAVMADNAFDSAEAGGSSQSGQSIGFGVSVMAGVHNFKAGDFEGTAVSLPLSFSVPLGEKYYGLVRAPLSYTKIGDAKAYHAGLNLSVPITTLENDEWLWVLSPSVGVAASFSEDFGAGAALWSGGLTSSLRRDFGSFYVTLGNHISFYEGLDIEVDDYEVGSDLSQTIVKNGLKISVPLDENRWEVEGYVIHTAFLEDAAVDDYLTPGVQLTRVFGESRDGARISVRVEGDIGDDYDSVGVRFGGGFKF